MRLELGRVAELVDRYLLIEACSFWILHVFWLLNQVLLEILLNGSN